MAAPSCTVNIVDTIHVSAPAGSVPTTTLPLNYLTSHAKLMCRPPPLKSYILYIESTVDVKFNHLIANYPRDFKSLHPYVVELPPSTMSSDGVRVLPLMAIKVTVFPNIGVRVLEGP
ncbi:hypothetical protein V6N13_046667 [Hibiscus sabdariffa]|uniref:Uncharacterized protein n=2 Tax=Hibiscus sabdariffa TaxID=183260 RepID=A0ABR2NZU4_9ROSI